MVGDLRKYATAFPVSASVLMETLQLAYRTSKTLLHSLPMRSPSRVTSHS
jgi:hypothetical protein